MMRPPFCFSIGRMAACVSVNAAVRLVAMTASQSSRFIRISSWSRVIPALQTTMSSRPCVLTISPGTFASAASSVTSSVNASARPPAATISSAVAFALSARAAQITSAPCAASRVAMAFPMPREAPVTSAILLARLNIDS